MIHNNLKTIITFFNKPYDLLQDKRVKLLMVCGVLIGFILVVLLAPFGIVVWFDLRRFLLVLFACILASIIVAIHVYVLQDLIFKKFTIPTTIIWWIWIDVVIGFNNFILYCVFMNKGVFLWKYVGNEILAAIILDIIPTIIIILLYHIYFLKSKIIAVNQINSDLYRYRSTLSENPNLTLTSKNLKEAFTINSDALLYITSADNYVELYWLEEGQIKRSLLRRTLTDVEKELRKQCRFILRCHNSFIVNIKQIDSISGNSGGYRIMLNRSDFTIPISRKYRDKFFKQLNQ